MIKKLYLILVLYACIVNVYSQNKLPKYEIIDGLKLASQEIESKIDDEFIKIPLEYYGLIIAYMPNQYSTKGSNYIFGCYFLSENRFIIT